MYISQAYFLNNCGMHQISTHEELLSMQQANKHVICVFSAEWCGPCQKLKTDLKDFMGTTKNTAWLMVDVDNAERMCAQYNIQQIPRVLFFTGQHQLCDQHGLLAEDVEKIAKKNNFS